MVPDKNRPLLKSTTAKNITNTAKGGTIYNPSKDILNFADREIGNVAIKITNITVDNTLKKELSRRPPFLYFVDIACPEERRVFGIKRFISDDEICCIVKDKVCNRNVFMHQYVFVSHLTIPLFLYRIYRDRLCFQQAAGTYHKTASDYNFLHLSFSLSRSRMRIALVLASFPIVIPSFTFALFLFYHFF